MKIKKIIATVAAVFALGTSAFAFEWSECWQNYGGGIEKGDMILSVGLGLNYGAFSYLGDEGGYFIPNILADFEIAQPIWLLPFTFGGYLGVDGYGCKTGGDYNSWVRTSFGGLAKYHVQLPVEKLDVYLGLKLGLSIWNNKWDYDNSNGTNNSGSDSTWYFDGNYVLGASYYFTNLIGVNAELGYPYTRVAVAVKF